MKNQIRLCIGFAILLAATTQAQEQLAKSIHDTRIETTRTSEQLKSTLNALNALTQQTKGDLRPAYNTFASAVTNTALAADITAARVRWMDGDGLKYFQKWQDHPRYSFCP